MEPVQIAHDCSRQIEAHDFEKLRNRMAPSVRLRALLPDGAETWEGSQAAAACFAEWFGPWSLKLLDHHVGEVAGRWSIINRFDARNGSNHSVIEQHIYCTIGASGIEEMDLLCSGFRSIPVADGSYHVFDAGDLGCGDGFAAAFRRQLDAIPAGAILEVITNDPAAREDLPPLARMLGNTILDVRNRDDGRTVVLVEKRK